MWYLQSQYYHFLPRGGDGNRKCLNPPQIQITGDTLYCLGRPILLTAENIAPGQGIGNTFFWTGPDGYTSNTNQVNYLNINGGPSTFTVTVTNVDGCTSTANINVESTFIALSLSVESITLESSQSIGDGQIILSASGGYTSGDYTFNIEMNSPILGDPAYSQTNNTGIFTGSFTYNQVFNISVSDEAGCQAIDILSTPTQCVGDPPNIRAPFLIQQPYPICYLASEGFIFQVYNSASGQGASNSVVWIINDVAQTGSVGNLGLGIQLFSINVTPSTFNNTPGIYENKVIMTNSNFCVQELDFQIELLNNITPSLISLVTSSSPSSEDGEIIVEASGGTPLYDYTLIAPDFSSTTTQTGVFSNLNTEPGQVWTLQTLDSNGCQAEPFIINIP
jgi:hypothetical protein